MRVTWKNIKLVLRELIMKRRGIDIIFNLKQCAETINYELYVS